LQISCSSAAQLGDDDDDDDGEGVKRCFSTLHLFQYFSSQGIIIILPIIHHCLHTIEQQQFMPENHQKNLPQFCI
jgi:hypothetical protein